MSISGFYRWIKATITNKDGTEIFTTANPGQVAVTGSLASDSGLAANRPAANAVRAGFIYYSVDTDTLEYSDGVQWVVI
jgi:hypothetical protein